MYSESGILFRRTEMSDKLKPVRCGCGGEAEIVKRFSPDYDLDVFYAKCKNCGIETDEYFLEDEAIVAWNIAMGAPSAEPGRKKGKWIEINRTSSFIWLRCSECGYGANGRTNFCPNCGADMSNDVSVGNFEK